MTLAANVGVAARNAGLRRAAGRLRMFLDSDARLTAGALPELVGFLDAHPEVGLVGPKLVYEDGTLQLSARRFPPRLLPLMRRPPLGRLFEDSAPVRRHLMADERHDRTREVEYVLGACQLFTAEAQAAAGEIDPRIFFGPDDVDWCLRIRRAGLQVALPPRRDRGPRLPAHVGGHARVPDRPAPALRVRALPVDVATRAGEARPGGPRDGRQGWSIRGPRVD